MIALGVLMLTLKDLFFSTIFFKYMFSSNFPFFLKVLTMGKNSMDPSVFYLDSTTTNPWVSSKAVRVN